MRDVRAVGFLDLARYTSLTEVHGDETAADVVDRFCEVVRASLRAGDVLVKSIGDAVLVHSDDADALARLTMRVCETLDGEPAFPVLRVGLHTGVVVARAGDVFGQTVNVAARVAAQAHGSQVLATATFADALTEGPWQARPLGAVPIKGLTDPVDVVELELCPHPQERPIDPLCGMALSPGSSEATVVLDGHEHAFCSRDCLRRWVSAL